MQTTGKRVVGLNLESADSIVYLGIMKAKRVRSSRENMICQEAARIKGLPQQVGWPPTI